MNKKTRLMLVLSLTFTSLVPLQSAQAQVGDPMLGEISYFAGNFAPPGWALCNGQLLDIANNSALFSLLGTIYGGDGRTTFALPDMRGRIALHYGTGAVLPSVQLGQKGGTETVTLTVANLPPHTHTLSASSDNATSTVPTNKALASNNLYKSVEASDVKIKLNQGTLTNVVGSQPINNIQPSTTAQCIIAIQGIYPSRS